MKNLNRLVLAILLLVAAVETVGAAEPRKLPLTERDKTDIQRAEVYLNGITTLKARFLQISPNGTSAEGDAYLSRPGKLRMQYDPPSPLLVVADGSFLIVFDRQLGEPSYLPLNSTPAGILVRAGVSLNSGDVAVTRVVRLPGVIRISMVEADDPTAGEITLVFSDAPFALRQWQVKDAQSQITTVSLFEAENGLTLDPKLFQFQNPNFIKPKLNFNNG